MSEKQPAVATLTGALLAPKGEARPAEGGDLDFLTTTQRRGPGLLPYAALFLAGAALPALAVFVWLMVKETPTVFGPTGPSLATGPSETLLPAGPTPTEPEAKVADASQRNTRAPAEFPPDNPPAREPLPALGPLNPAAGAAVGVAETAPVPDATPAAAAPPPAAPAEAQPQAAPPMTIAAATPPPPPPPIEGAAEPLSASPAPEPAAHPAPQHQGNAPPARRRPPASVAAPAPPKPRPDALAARKSDGPGYYAQLSSVPSRALVDDEMKRLGRLFSRALSGRKLVVHDGLAHGGATVYRIRVGPLAGRSAARRLCAAVKARRGGCLVVRLPDAT